MPLNLDPDNPSSRGNKFYVVFMHLIYETDPVLLVSTAESDPVNFTVTTFFEGNQNSIDYVATYGSTTRVSFPVDSVYVTNSSQRDRAILIQAEEGKTISVYGASEDGFLALPCDGMKANNFNNYKYIIFSGESPPYLQALSEFVVIPCEENTTIDITPSQLVTVEADDFKTTQFGPTSSQSILSATWEDNNGNLPRAGTTLLVSDFEDLTGTLVSGDKPLAVFSGHQCASIPNMPFDNYTCGHLVEQIPPHTTSGSTFFLTPLAIRETGDYYRVATVYDNTEVAITCVDEGGGSTVKTDQFSLNGGQGQIWREYLTQEANVFPHCINPFNRKFCSLQASNPVIVAQYGQGLDDCNGYNFPFMSLLPPVVQSLNNYTISTLNESCNDYISIAVHDNFFDPNRIMIDDVPAQPDRSAWQGIYCSDGEICGYGIYREITSGDHIVYHEIENAALTVQYYGFKNYNIYYGYAAGMELQPISGRCFANKKYIIKTLPQLSLVEVILILSVIIMPKKCF